MTSFKKQCDPLVSLGVGKKALIIKWLDDMDVENYIINDDYTIDVKRNLSLCNKNFVRFPDYIKFGKVGGHFSCHNTRLVSLEGAPYQIAGFFWVHHNNLTNLTGSPKYILGSYWVNSNNLVSLEGCPEEVNHNFYIKDNTGIKFTEEDIRKVCNVKGEIII
jgi:hypothetical protein